MSAAVPPILIENARVIAGEGQPFDGWVLTENGVIAAIGRGTPPPGIFAERINAQGLTALPGFIDIHTHGARGYDTMDASAEGLRMMAQFYAQHGVTSFLATTWTDTRVRINAALDNVASMIGRVEGGATLLGVHLEGPFLNPEKCGAQNAEYIRRAYPEEALEFLHHGVIRLISIAPEYSENAWLIRECAWRGIAVSAAHTAATYDDICAVIPLGLTQTTHTFNAMTPLHHRDPGVVGAALASPELRCELIADNIHVHPGAMRVLAVAKGSRGVILITDSVRAAGMPEGTYTIDERTVVLRDGAVRLPDGTLAGSVLTMERALRNFLAAVSGRVDHWWPVTSLNAAEAIGIAHRKGSLTLHKDADIVLLDEATCAVRLTMAEGRVIYRGGL